MGKLLPLRLYNDGYIVIVKPLDEVVDEFSRFYMYVFKTKDDADTFGFMVSKFMIKSQALLSWVKFPKTSNR